ncbi:MAG: hypothetical protein ACTSUE_25275 [Promethearchaeota archaeon]
MAAQDEYLELNDVKPLRRGTERKLLEQEYRNEIIYAPGHDPYESNSTKDKGYNLTKARQYDVDTILENGIVYISVAGCTCFIGFFVFILFIVHVCFVRQMIAQEAYDLVYPVKTRKYVNRDCSNDFDGICNLYINRKIVSIILIFALGLITYQTLVLICPVMMPKWLICTPDPAWLSLVHLPVNVVAVILLIMAAFYWNYHAVLIHSVITMYASVFLCMVLFGLASSHKSLCLQTVATQVMFTLSAWIFLWPPKIAGMASLRDRLAWEKRVLRMHDKVELARLRDVLGSSAYKNVDFGSDSSEPDVEEGNLEDPIQINL